MAEASPKTPKKAAKTEAAGAKTETKKAVAKTVLKKAVPAAVASKPAVEKKLVAAKKPAPAKATTKTATLPKPAEKKAPTKAGTISDEQRYRMIAEAAYYRAESNHFKSDSVRDWIEAESDIAALLSGSK